MTQMQHECATELAAGGAPAQGGHTTARAALQPWLLPAQALDVDGRELPYGEVLRQYWPHVFDAVSEQSRWDRFPTFISSWMAFWGKGRPWEGRRERHALTHPRYIKYRQGRLWDLLDFSPLFFSFSPLE